MSATDSAPLLSEPPIAPDLSGSQLLIRGWGELRAHVRARGKLGRYRRLLEQFGVAPDTIELAELANRTTLIFFEQPGCYLTARDLMRARLLERLIARDEFDAESSGIKTLPNDRFTARGPKGVFLEFSLHPELGPARLFSVQYIQKYKHQTYSSLKIGGNSFQRIRAIWDYSLQLIEAAAESPARFADVAAQLQARPAVPGACDLLPGSRDPDELLRLGERLGENHLEAAFKALWPARTHLRRDLHWELYWSRVNADFLELPVGSTVRWLERFVLAVEDPVRLGRKLHESLGAEPGQPVPVAAIGTEKEAFRTVMFEPASDTFFLARGDGFHQPIDWTVVRDAALANQGARPAGVFLYLMLAAFGIYLLVDPGDPLQPFQETVCRLHERQIGLKYPWITFALPSGPERSANSFLDVFRPGFARQTVDALSGFFDS